MRVLVFVYIIEEVAHNHAGSDAKACPIARGKSDSEKHGFG